MSKGLTELTGLKAQEVSAVKAGANLKKRFPVTKQEEIVPDQTNEEILKAVVGIEVDEEAQLSDFFEKSKMSEGAQEATRGIQRILAAYKDEMSSDVLKELAKISGYAEPVEKKEPDKKKEFPPKPDEEEEEDMKEKEKEVKKGMSPEIEAIFKAQEQQLEELKKSNESASAALKVEKDKRELAEWTAKAENELSHYPGKSSAELGTMLKSLHDANPEAAKEQFTLLKSASDALKESGILKEAGNANAKGAGAGSAWDKIQKMAEGLVEKSAEESFTIEKAYRLVIQRNPGLYKEYLEENPAQCGAN